MAIFLVSLDAKVMIAPMTSTVCNFCFMVKVPLMAKMAVMAVMAIMSVISMMCVMMMTLLAVWTCLKKRETSP